MMMMMMMMSGDRILIERLLLSLLLRRPIYQSSKEREAGRERERGRSITVIVDYVHLLWLEFDFGFFSLAPESPSIA